MRKILIVAIGSGLLVLSAGSGLLSSVFSAGSSEVQSDRRCQDLLAQLTPKPPEIEFLQCKQEKQASSDVLVAIYSVKGKDAAAVEKFLQNKFDMSQLQFLCCGWQPASVYTDSGYSSGRGSYKDERGCDYEITMFSEETLLNQRQDWEKIPWFYIAVTKFLEKP